MRLTTWVLDVSRGLPAQDMRVRLYRCRAADWDEVGENRTDVDGWVMGWAPGDLALGGYRLVLDTGRFYSAQGVVTAQTAVTIEFAARSARDDLHVCVMLSPFGYSTYTVLGR